MTAARWKESLMEALARVPDPRPTGSALPVGQRVGDGGVCDGLWRAPPICDGPLGQTVGVTSAWDTGVRADAGPADLRDESTATTQPCGWDGDYRPVRQVAKGRNGILSNRRTVPQ